MATITVNKLSTSNTTPTITGTVDFARFDLSLNPKESIQITVNYHTYKLFAGNLGLDETVKPNVWKLHFDSPLYPGTYDVEATVIDINSNTIIASDNTKDELIITYKTTNQINDSNSNLMQKFIAVNSLMNGLASLFGGQNGISPVASVHPVQDDDSTTSLTARDGKEGKEALPRKSREKTNIKSVPLPPKKPKFDVTDPGGVFSDMELASLDSARLELADVAEAQTAVEAATEAVRSAPDEAAALVQQQYSSTPTSPFG
jgi:hypothetical protein